MTFHGFSKNEIFFFNSCLFYSSFIPRPSAPHSHSPSLSRCLFILSDRFSYSSVWSLTHYLVKDNFDLLMFWLPPFQAGIKGIGHHTWFMSGWGANQGFMVDRQALYQFTYTPVCSPPSLPLFISLPFLYCLSLLFLPHSPPSFTPPPPLYPLFFPFPLSLPIQALSFHFLPSFGFPLTWHMRTLYLCYTPLFKSTCVSFSLTHTLC